MVKTTYTYPGDPRTEVRLMFGQEFLAENPDREIRISAQGQLTTRIPVEDAICDSCNASVPPTDPCSVANDRLYCWDCHVRWIRPHLD